MRDAHVPGADVGEEVGFWFDFAVGEIKGEEAGGGFGSGGGPFDGEHDVDEVFGDVESVGWRQG